LTASTSQPDGGYLAEYEVRIGNQGPGYAPVRLIDPYTGSSEGVFDWDNASRTCSVEPAPQFEDGVVKSQCQDDSAGLLPGAELVYQIKVPVPADQLPPGGRVVNVARA